MRKRIISAGVLSTLVVAGVATTALAPTAAFAATPTVTITTTPYGGASGGFYDGQTVNVTGSGFTPSSTVQLAECSNKVITGSQTANCDLSTVKQVTADSSGNIATTFQVLSVSYSDTAGDICDSTNANSCLIGASDGTNQGAAGIPLLHGLTASALTGLTNGQQLTVKANGYEADAGTATGQYIVECSAGVLNNITSALSYCDTGTVVIGSANPDGTVTPSQKLTVHAGSAFGAKGLCDGTHPCVLVVTDNISPTSVAQAFAASGFVPITFNHTIVTQVATSTKLKPAAKSGRRGTKMAVTATTKPTKGEGAFGGKLVVTDNGKKVGTFTEPKSGTVKFKVKLLKGKNKIVAKYSGNKFFKKSAGSTSVLGK